MNTINGCKLMFCLGLAILCTGCFGQPEPNDLSNLTSDADGDGFLDLTPPAGIPFDGATNLRIRVGSDISRDDIEAVASALGVDPNLLSVVEDRILLTIVLDYGNGITQQLEEVRRIEPFELAVEVACPEDATVDVLVQGTAPIIGTQDVFTGSYFFDRGVDYTCGDRLEVIAETDGAGNVSISIE